MKLWQKQTDIDSLVERFTVGDDPQLDLLLTPYDVLGSMAHAVMLQSVGLLESAELEALLKELYRLYQQAENGRFEIDAGIEDVHSQVELILTDRVGDAGKKIHTARSRNDQVLLDLRLYTRDALENVVHRTQKLARRWLELSEQYRRVGLPGYTHLQIAMPSSFGLWFTAYAESLTDDLLQLQAAYAMVDRNPLGSAAGYGSSFPIDRELTTRLLGFASPCYSSVYAQLSRGKMEQVVAAAMAQIAQTIGRFSMDICLYVNQNFDFLSFPDQLTTGSSIMPHKKNPDLFELVRGRAQRMQTLPGAIGNIFSGLPSGYHRDLQEVKSLFLPAFETLFDMLEMLTYAMDHIRINENILDDPKYDYLFTVEAVNDLVQQGIPFREAYRQIGEQVEHGSFSPNRKLDHRHLGSIGNPGTKQVIARLKQITDGFDFSRKNEAIARLLRQAANVS